MPKKIIKSPQDELLGVCLSQKLWMISGEVNLVLPDIRVQSFDVSWANLIHI